MQPKKNYFQLVKFSILTLMISGLNMACAARLGPTYITSYNNSAKQPALQPLIAVPLKSVLVMQRSPKLEIQTTDKLRFTLDSVYFEVDKANLSPAGQLKIAEFVTTIKRYGPSSVVQLDGHTDSTGEKIYNQYLSESRAHTVRNALIARGIEPKRLIAKGFGETNPLTTNVTKNGRQQNRRVDITVIK